MASTVKHTQLDYVIGSDRAYAFEITDVAEAVAINISGWAISFRVKRRLSDADTASITGFTKTTASGIVIAGTFNADPAVNTQKATVTLVDTETDAAVPGLYRYELKRTDAGFEVVLADGTFLLIQGIHRT